MECKKISRIQVLRRALEKVLNYCEPIVYLFDLFEKRQSNRPVRLITGVLKVPPGMGIGLWKIFLPKPPVKFAEQINFIKMPKG